MKPQVLLLVMAIVVICVVTSIYFFTPHSLVRKKTVAPPLSPRDGPPVSRGKTTDNSTSEGEMAKERPASSKKGYFLSMHYTEQLTGSTANFLSLQCFVGHHLKNVVTVEPYLLTVGTVLGTTLSLSHETFKPEEANKVKLTDVFDREAWETYTKSRNYAPFVSWSSFLEDAPKEIIFAHHTWTTKECDPVIMRNSTKEFIIDNKFKVVRRVCLDFRKLGAITPDQFIKAIYGDYNPVNVVVMFNFWGGIVSGVENYRLTVKGTPCQRSNDIRLSLHSKQVSSDVEDYIERYLHKAKNYVAVMMRFEYLGIHHNMMSQSPDAQRKRLTDCFKSISSKVESLKHEKNIKDTLLTSDFSRVGSCAFWRKKNPFIDIGALNDTVPQLYSMLYGEKFNEDEWERSYESVAHFKAAGYIAIMQKALAANAACLILVGGGSFQGSAKTLHNQLHPGGGCVVQLC